MKKSVCILTILSLIFLLCACAEPAPSMYIEPAQLTEEEQALAELMGLNTANHIYDFKVDETIRRISVDAYELIDGEWHMFYGGGGRVFTDSAGRMMLDFENIEEGLYEAIQSENCNGSTGWKSESTADTAGTHRATSLLTQRQEIVYEQEIPLAVQIVTKKNEIRSFDPSYYFQPEEYEEYGYEHVYAVTVLFSQTPLE